MKVAPNRPAPFLFEGKQDVQTKVMVDLFGLFAEVERDLISEGTKEGLAAARAKGQLRGRPKGALILVANRPE